MSTEKPERVEPIRITDPETGRVYTLEYSRRTIERMERNGFVISTITDFPFTAIPAMFHGAFLKNHPGMTRDQTDKILYDIGATERLLNKLAALYNEPMKALFSTNDEGESETKNSRYTVEM